MTINGKPADEAQIARAAEIWQKVLNRSRGPWLEFEFTDERGQRESLHLSFANNEEVRDFFMRATA